jgi:Electron transfer flavoprotein FAD-binding domain
MPRSRQVGITGRSIAPQFYVAISLSGTFNHMVDVKSAANILAINNDPAAPVFDHCDVGIVADGTEVVPLLEGEVIAWKLAHGEGLNSSPRGPCGCFAVHYVSPDGRADDHRYRSRGATCRSHHPAKGDPLAARWRPGLGPHGPKAMGNSLP